ncbi:MAG: tRNA adenosine(34) deaminase TadA [Francisellaceae bacterium]
MNRNLKIATVEQQRQWMEQAIAAAMEAEKIGEVPVGAVVVKDNELVASGFNQMISLNDPSAHAEIIAMRKAGRKLQNYRLVDCDIFITLEPCMMCLGAMVHARIRHVYFGAFEPKAGVLCSNPGFHGLSFLNHRLEMSGGVLESKCSELLSAFFRRRRLEHKT